VAILPDITVLSLSVLIDKYIFICSTGGILRLERRAKRLAANKNAKAFVFLFAETLA